MRKKILIIGLQAFVIIGFIGMALGSSTTTPVAKTSQIKRLDRGACGHPDAVYWGTYASQDACQAACKEAGFTTSCLVGSNCYCK